MNGRNNASGLREDYRSESTIQVITMANVWRGSTGFVLIRSKGIRATASKE